MLAFGAIAARCRRNPQGFSTTLRRARGEIAPGFAAGNPCRDAETRDNEGPAEKSRNHAQRIAPQSLRRMELLVRSLQHRPTTQKREMRSSCNPSNSTPHLGRLLEQLPRERVLGVVLNRAEKRVDETAYYYQSRYQRQSPLVEAGTEEAADDEATDQPEMIYIEEGFVS